MDGDFWASYDLLKLEIILLIEAVERRVDQQGIWAFVLSTSILESLTQVYRSKSGQSEESQWER